MVVVENLSKTKSCGEMTKFHYTYRLIKSEILLTNEEESVKVQAYGIEVERQDIVGDIVSNIERDSIKVISPYRHKVHSLLKLLYDNLVSPCHLVDILGEYIDENISEFDNKLNEIAAN